MSQLVRSLFAALFVLLLGLAAPLTAVAAPALPASSYAYDGGHHEAALAQAITERGPPAAYDYTTIHDAGDDWSTGTSPRLPTPTPAITTYDYPATLAQVASVPRRTEGAAGNSTVPLSLVALRQVAAKGGPGVRSAFPGPRYPLHPKVQGQLGGRGWTTGQIDEAIQSGQQVRAINKATNNPATRYIHPGTGQSVVVDDVTGQVIHVGGPGFKYGPGSGDIP